MAVNKKGFEYEFAYGLAKMLRNYIRDYLYQIDEYPNKKLEEDLYLLILEHGKFETETGYNTYKDRETRTLIIRDLKYD